MFCGVWVNSWKRFYLYRKQGSPPDQDRIMELHIKARQLAIFGMAATSGVVLIVYERYLAVIICLVIGIVIGLFWNRISNALERFN